MRDVDLVELLRQRPFVPLRLHLSNGKSFDIMHPELAKVGRGTVVIYFLGPNQTLQQFDRYETISLLHINHVEQLHPVTPIDNGDSH